MGIAGVLRSRMLCFKVLPCLFVAATIFLWWLGLSTFRSALHGDPSQQRTLDRLDHASTAVTQLHLASPAPNYRVGNTTSPASAVVVASTGWNIDYLPPIMNSMINFHKATSLAPNSLDAMSAPLLYSRQTCPQLQQLHMSEYAHVVGRIDFTRPPKYKMPWYYHDPYALCGRYQLSHITAAVGGGQGSAPLSQPPPLLHRVVVASEARGGQTSDGQLAIAQVTAGVWSVGDISIEHCGQCAESVVGTGLRCADDVLILARLISEHTVVSADVLPVVDHEPRPYHPLRFLVRDPGEYILEVKLVHVNGSSSNASLPKSLGVIGIRASDHNRKSFKYNLVCDLQRHVYGSPVKVLALARGAEHSVPALPAVKPLCTASNFNQSIGMGHWVRVPYKTMCDAYREGRYCSGDPTWLTDACGFNTELVWAPDSCRMRLYSPPKGPEQSCLKRGRGGFILFVGDSVAREYVQNCRLFDFKAAKLHCLFANIALEGQHYSLDYTKAVVKAMVDSIKQNKPGVLATNLGIHHMIGKSSTAQWIEFIDVFVAAWKAEAFTVLEVGTDQWLLEKAVWLGPPTIHYARHGMGHQRAALWDEIAWKKLEPLGFRRLYAIAPTLSRTEATWDGLHYASYKGKVQSPWRNRGAPVLLWNGGVSNMLFNILLNLICEPVSL